MQLRNLVNKVLQYTNSTDQESLRFEIDQLRKDKIIYGVEACAVAATAILTYIFADEYFPSGLKTFTQVVAFLIGVGYTFYMGITNWFRLQRIKELEEKLKKNSK